jgi:integrase
MNIEQRRGLWFAVVTVPKDVRAALGSKFIQSLKTHDKLEAQARALPVVTQWKQEIRKARGQAASKDMTTKQWTPLEPLVAEWAVYANMTQKTLDQARRDLTKFVGRFRILEAITPRAIKLWIDELAAAGATHSSLKRVLSSCKSLWSYLRRSSIVELDRTDPFIGIFSLVSLKVTRNRQGRVAWAPDDLAKIYQAALDEKDQAVADIIALGAYTGARIDELGHLKVSDVTARGSLMITDSKTKAGIREIPLHPEVVSLVERLKRNAATEYLIPVNTDNQYDNRGDVLGKRFGRLKKSMGFAAGSQVFHSIRKTLITLLENAGVPEGVAADIVGHEKKTVTYGLYSMGTKLEIKRAALATISYPAPLQRLT